MAAPRRCRANHLRVQPSKKVAANWDDEGNPVSRDSDRKKT